MANKAKKFQDNVPGPFYVDEWCTDCYACHTIAPDNFKRNDEARQSYVSKQPETPEELHLCMDAMEGCPVESIGDDGDE